MSDTQHETLTPAVLESIIDVPAVAPIETEDGFLVNPQNDEVIGHIQDLPDRPFTIDSDESADWALKLLSGLEGDRAGLCLRRDALIGEMNKVIARVERKLSWWEFRFGPLLRAYAKLRLTGRSKTAQFSWGHVAFRETNGTNQIVSEQEALEYVETFAPHLVKVTKSVNITAVLEAAKIAEQQTGEKQHLAFMRHSGAETRATISTGIKLEGGKK
jgi:hypothetical protein